MPVIFILWKDYKMTDLVNLAIRKILLLIEITSEERNHSRAGMRIRRKLSPLFAKTYDKIKSNYSIINQEDGKNFMRAEFHCYSRISGRKIYRELKKEFFK